MSPPARWCSRLVPLLMVLWAVDRSGATQLQPSADVSTASDSELALRVIVDEVTSKIQPLINQLDSRIDSRIDRLDSRIDSWIDRLDSRLISFDTRLNGIETRLNARDFVQETFDARLTEYTSRVEFTEGRLNSRHDELVSRVDSTEGRLDSRLDQLVSRINSTEGRLDSRHDEVVSRVDSTEGTLYSRLDELVSQTNATEGRLDSRLDQLVSRVNGLAAGQTGHLDGVSSRLDGMSSRLDELSNGTDRKLIGLADRHIWSPPPRDCSQVPTGAQSGIHLLQLELDTSPVPAYCDLDSDGGGWTVIQRRRDIEPRQDFNLDWSAYREGFGELDAEFWWGLESLWRLTGSADRQFELRVNLADFDGERRHAIYGRFRVASEADGYQLTVSDYTGDAGDSLGGHSGHKFSTRDRDQDGHTAHCAQGWEGGWWYGKCHRALLNGQYPSGKQDKEGGVKWGSWGGYDHLLKETEMKIRPVNTD